MVRSGNATSAPKRSRTAMSSTSGVYRVAPVSQGRKQRESSPSRVLAYRHTSIASKIDIAQTPSLLHSSESEGSLLQ